MAMLEADYSIPMASSSKKQSSSCVSKKVAERNLKQLWNNELVTYVLLVYSYVPAVATSSISSTTSSESKYSTLRHVLALPW